MATQQEPNLGHAWTLHAPTRRCSTLGIDLASQPRNTGACRIDWVGSRGTVLPLPSGPLTDAALIDLISDPAVVRVGIDAPFGWPVTFVDALVAYRERSAWPDGPDRRDEQCHMELRATDEVVWRKLKVKPLGVAVDRIAYAAMRCARLFAALSLESGQIDRSGEGRMVEAYPEAALRCWGLSPGQHPEDPGSYKGKSPEARIRREELVRRLLEQADGWLEVPDGVSDRCRASDDHLDSLLCALIARAADLGRVEPVDDPESARSEGWIRLPLSEPLGRLGQAGAAS